MKNIRKEKETAYLLKSEAMKERLLAAKKREQGIPFEGVGKPEALKYALAGCWSRRIDDEHRLVYEVLEERPTV